MRNSYYHRGFLFSLIVSLLMITYTLLHSFHSATLTDGHNKQLTWENLYQVSEDYTGFTVEGWPSSKNRSMPLYVHPDEDNFLLKPEIDLNIIRIIVIVHSGDIMARRRQANRDSWIKNSYAGSPGDCYKEVKVIFHIGASQNETIM